MRKHGSVYWHVGNSGVTFEVVDQGQGATFVAKSGSFGNLLTTFEAHTDEYSLRMLGLMLLHAAEGRFSETYCNPALASPPRKQRSDSTSYSKGDEAKSPPTVQIEDAAGNMQLTRGKSHVAKFFEKEKGDKQGDKELTAVDGAFAILTASAVFARVPHIVLDKDSYDILQWFPNLNVGALQWLWDRGFLHEPQHGVLGWNPDVELFQPPVERTPNWQDAIAEAREITIKMPVTNGGPLPTDMGRGLYRSMPDPLLAPSLPFGCKCGPHDACPRCDEGLQKAHNAPAPSVPRKRPDRPRPR